MLPSVGPTPDLPYALPTRTEPRAPAESATGTAPLVRSDSFRASLRTPLDADRRLALLGDPPFQATDTPQDMERSKPLEEAGKSAPQGKNTEKDSSGAPLSEEQQQQITELKKRDQEVRAHEQAHLAAAGGMARGGAALSYETGPDGRKYAVGGEVQIVMRSGRSPEETIRNARQVQAAAMAPASPSSTDQQTAAAAARMEQEARAELAAGGSAGKDDEEKSGKSPSTGSKGPEANAPRPEIIAEEST
jgi:hypothetical protein